MILADVMDFLKAPEDFDISHNGRKVEYLNEEGTPSDNSAFFLAGHEFGASVLVHIRAYRGDGFETAYGAWIDSCPTIPEKELVEAYGPADRCGGSFLDVAHAELSEINAPYGSEAWYALVAKIHARAKELLDEAETEARDGGGNYPGLIEGYRMQDNCSGTGVVSVGDYEWMREADLSEIEIVRKAEVGV